MLRQRLITASLLFLLFLVLIFWAPCWVFLVFLMLLAFLAGREWGHLSLIAWPNGLALILAALFPMLIFFSQHLPGSALALGSVIWWVLLAVLLMLMPPSRLPEAAAWQRPMSAMAVFPVLLPALLFSLSLQQRTPQFLLWVILIISAGDVGAMTFGKIWGRHPLVPRISPGKTWEGLLGGLLASVIMGTLGAWMWIGAAVSSLRSGAVLGLITGIFAVLGDLAESFLKRRASCKDSGQLLPGHGGLLDRLDSMSAGIPVFVAGLYYLGWWK
ncbi:phosphatidate cytidylyltransferase [Acidithiobacillus ferrivorans]|uniref:Phosphatidate cytidylyltransferase n=1 Tax=Acidithiobacillus ferrivorans TaxID=160808 RepID=A0A1B9BUI8_9PROT|nr:CDP-archaeol synthase [Acidithiobacillus ferrivorans]OCB01364.1 phosphatidate cytidylyltransferase [Acidithiobacillus ferrivorans]